MREHTPPTWQNITVDEKAETSAVAPGWFLVSEKAVALMFNDSVSVLNSQDTDKGHL